MDASVAWKLRWRVSIDGRDITSKMNPYVQSIEVADKDGTASDTASLVLDDTDAQILLPRAGGLIEVGLEGVNVFKGTIDEIRSTGARGQGRIITVSAKGFDSRGKIKAPLDFHKDGGTLQAFANDAARRADLDSIIIDPAFGNITRDYWSADGESFLHLMQRLAQELGATFKIRANQGVFAKRGEGVTPSGKPMPSLTGTYGDNLVSWDISPFIGRPRSKKARVKFYNREAAKYEHKDVDIETDAETPDSTVIPANDAANGDAAAGIATGKKTSSVRESGEGSVQLILTPQARVEGTFVIKGARPGVDGSYRIAGVQHSCDRSSGSKTTLELKQPGKGTGASGDTRTPEFNVEQFIAEQRSANESQRDQVDPGAPAF